MKVKSKKLKVQREEGNFRSPPKNFKLKNGGSVWVGLLLVMVFLITLGLALYIDVVTTIVQTKRSEQVLVAQSLSDAGIEKAVWKLNQTGGSYTGEIDIDMTTGTLDINVTSIDSQTKSVLATAYVPSKTNPKVTRKVRSRISATPNEQDVSFHYAIQAGTGGINVSGSSEIDGNLFSNGNVTFSGGGYDVTGDVSAHGIVSPDPNPRVHGTITTGVPEVSLPQVDIDAWENYASTGDTISGSYSPSGTVNLGPTKITGSFSMSGSGTTVNLGGPLYIQGAVNISGGTFRLSDSLGSSGTIIIVDGAVSISGGASFISNAGGGYIMFLSTYNNINAISYSGSASSEALAVYAYNGGMTLTGSGEIVALCGQTLNISGSGEIKYKSGLADANFSAGPGGSWQIKEWQIVY